MSSTATRQRQRPKVLKLVKFFGPPRCLRPLLRSLSRFPNNNHFCLVSGGEKATKQGGSRANDIETKRETLKDVRPGEQTKQRTGKRVEEGKLQHPTHSHRSTGVGGKALVLSGAAHRYERFRNSRKRKRIVNIRRARSELFFSQNQWTKASLCELRCSSDAETIFVVSVAYRVLACFLFVDDRSPSGVR